MPVQETITRIPSVYVGTYYKYNTGSLFGAWIDLEEFSNKYEFLKACRKLHADESDPEFMFQDYTDIPEGLMNEGFITEQVFEFVDRTESWSSQYLNAFYLYLDDNHYELNQLHRDIDQMIGDFEDKYVGYYGGSFNPRKDFAEELFDEFHIHRIPSEIEGYIDYEAFATDLFIDTYWERDGHIFQR